MIVHINRDTNHFVDQTFMGCTFYFGDVNYVFFSRCVLDNCSFRSDKPFTIDDTNSVYINNSFSFEGSIVTDSSSVSKILYFFKNMHLRWLQVSYLSLSVEEIENLVEVCDYPIKFFKAYGLYEGEQELSVSHNLIPLFKKHILEKPDVESYKALPTICTDYRTIYRVKYKNRPEVLWCHST